MYLIVFRSVVLRNNMFLIPMPSQKKIIFRDKIKRTIVVRPKSEWRTNNIRSAAIVFIATWSLSSIVLRTHTSDSDRSRRDDRDWRFSFIPFLGRDRNGRNEIQTFTANTSSFTRFIVHNNNNNNNNNNNRNIIIIVVADEGTKNRHCSCVVNGPLKYQTISRTNYYLLEIGNFPEMIININRVLHCHRRDRTPMLSKRHHAFYSGARKIILL